MKVLQLSDIHVSKFNKKYGKNLFDFCTEFLPRLLKKESIALVVSGDLVDADPYNMFIDRNGQYEEDWIQFRKSFEPCMQIQSLPIFTIRGNHDCYGVTSWNSQDNKSYREFQADVFKRMTKLIELGIYKNFQVSSEPGNKNSQIIRIENLNLLLLDNCDPSGSLRQIYANLDESTVNWIKTTLRSSSSPYLASLRPLTVISHYPTGSYIYEDRMRLLQLLKYIKAVSYHAGHVHTAMGYTLMAKQRVDEDYEFLEFEVADFRDRQSFRLIDTDLMEVYDFERGKKSASHSKHHWPDQVGSIFAYKNQQNPKYFSLNSAIDHVGTHNDSNHLSTPPVKFESRWLLLTMYAATPETLNFVNGFFILINLTFALIYALRQKHLKFFAWFNVAYIITLPILPLGVIKVLPDHYGLHFYAYIWNFTQGWFRSDVGHLFMPHIQIKILLGTFSLMIVKKYPIPSVKKTACILVSVLSLYSQYKALCLGGPFSAFLHPIIWDIAFFLFSEAGMGILLKKNHFVKV
jgi:Calcineurin-like phosphoesterase